MFILLFYVRNNNLMKARLTDITEIRNPSFQKSTTK